ncbi:hypothetical protein WOLCODRAFT_22373 [Wolfiporia cocos MD-104 SS10]|uniref:Uncharacterized protein n=1 Tax=Wolfiporia cocos (strain MD-104) TaxID=742152 RepID=A0A2H3J2I2_WOLCO|nr:hypothetical protein WOLCODRAFT_22373 [Wolfiporia cocos MD-104 SS10]
MHLGILKDSSASLSDTANSYAMCDSPAVSVKMRREENLGDDSMAGDYMLQTPSQLDKLKCSVQ